MDGSALADHHEHIDVTNSRRASDSSNNKW